MMKKIVGLLRRFNVKQRLFGFILIPLFLMIICFLFYYSFSKDMLYQKNDQASRQRVSMAEESLYLTSLRISESFDDFCRLISDTTSDKQVVQDKIENELEMLHASRIFIYHKNGQLLFQGGGAAIPYSSSWKKQQWIYDEANDVLLLQNVIYENDELLGYAYAAFPKEIFSLSFSNENTNNMALVIADQNNRVLIGQELCKQGYQLEINDGEALINHQSYYVHEQSITGTGWKVIDLVNKEYVYEEIHNFRNMLLLYSAASFIILFIFSSIFYHSIHDPIHHILVSMHDFNENDMKQSKIIDTGKDEIHTLNETFNELVVRIGELLSTVQREQEQKRETQIQLLQAQINPHFLFNTLNTLRYLAILNEDKPVSEGISALAKLLRNTIVDSNEMVSVQEEIENVKNYIIIQKLRYGDLFETVYNIDENVRRCKILKFLLQPIVENSILHAFEEDREHQILTIRARKWRDCLRIEIGDNGKGFRVDLDKNNKKLSSIGMRNIQERIQLMYGDQYTMKVESVINVGTITTLFLPLHE